MDPRPLQRQPAPLGRPGEGRGGPGGRGHRQRLLGPLGEDGGQARLEGAGGHGAGETGVVDRFQVGLRGGIS